MDPRKTPTTPEELGRLIERNMPYFIRVVSNNARGCPSSMREDLLQDALTSIWKNRERVLLSGAGQEIKSFLTGLGMRTKSVVNSKLRSERIRQRLGITGSSEVYDRLRGVSPYNVEELSGLNLSPERTLELIESESIDARRMNILRKTEGILTDQQRIVLQAERQGLKLVETVDQLKEYGINISFQRVAQERERIYGLFKILFDPLTYESIPLVNDLMAAEIIGPRREIYNDEALGAATGIDLSKMRKTREIWGLPVRENRRIAYVKGKETPFFINPEDPLYVQIREVI